MKAFFDIDFWTEVLHTIGKNKGRSFLTAFGVFWGIFIFVLLKGMGDGLEKQLLGLFSDQAKNMLVVMPGKTLEAYKGFQVGRWPAFHYDDLLAVKEEFPEITTAVPMINPSWSERSVKFGDKKFEFDSFVGIAPEFGRLNVPLLLEGRFINDLDVHQKRKVCIIGEEIKNAIFGSDAKAEGQVVWLGSSAYMVVGVARQKGEVFMLDYGKSVIIPYTTARLVSGISGDIIHYAYLALPDNQPECEERVKAFLKSRWDVSPTDRGGIMAFNTKELFDSVKSLFNGINALTYLVGLGTLLAGIVGVCNIMLVTVRERTQEIGVKRALGATPVVIIRQIMCESLMLSLVAGLAGVVAGVGVLSVADFVLQHMQEPLLDSVQLSFSSAVTAVTIITVLGCAAGLLPSYRAVNVKAIEALHDE